MTRRRAAGSLCILLPPLLRPSLLRPQEASEIFNVVTPLAAALARGAPEDFLRHITGDAPDRDRLANNIRGLLAQAEITSSVKLTGLENGGAQLNWYMEIRSRSRQMMLERRKGTVFIRLRDGTVASLEPVDFFKPAEIR